MSLITDWVQREVAFSVSLRCTCSQRPKQWLARLDLGSGQLVSVAKRTRTCSERAALKISGPDPAKVKVASPLHNFLEVSRAPDSGTGYVRVDVVGMPCKGAALSALTRE